ncbi:MAG: hypothetical protein Kow0032_28280 [Methyloligellaceae bacterium]
MESRPRPVSGAARKDGWLTQLHRLIRYRLAIPIKRSRHSPEHTARGVMVGCVWACTPLFGLHMTGALLTWIVARKLFRWDFSLVNALAWTWTTNVFTVIPCYYLFYLTGQAMLGRFTKGDEAGEGFEAIAAQITGEHPGVWDTIRLWFESLVSNVGMPLAVGWIPWGILAGWLAYRLSYSFVVRYQARRGIGR